MHQLPFFWGDAGLFRSPVLLAVCLDGADGQRVGVPPVVLLADQQTPAEIQHFSPTAQDVLATFPVQCLACLIEQGKPLPDRAVLHPCERHRANREQVAE
jgi:hypothetical protein